MKIFVISKTKALPNRMKTLFPEHVKKVEWRQSAVISPDPKQYYDIILIESSVYKNAETALIKFLKKISKQHKTTQILLLVPANEMETAMSALKAGTYHYAKLPVSDEELRLLILTAMDDKPKAPPKFTVKKGVGFEKLVGKSKAMRSVYRQIKRAAATEIPILILGETGTGKDLAAQAIHRNSERRSSPYIPVNLGAVPPELIGSELFGYEKGAFTGAVKQHKGKFEQSSEGTIFLDEIDSADEKVQVSLLRIIEQHKFQRIGGTKEIKSNARLIAASNSDLEELAKSGSFREDLFYRLDVFRIVMPALRERVEDLPLLVEVFMSQFCAQFQKNITEVDDEFIPILGEYDWPGNVRELKNVIQRAILVCDQEQLTQEHLPLRLRKDKTHSNTITFEIGTSLDSVERQMVLKALKISKNNRTKAADLLGISRRAIYNKLRKHKIK